MVLSMPDCYILPDTPTAHYCVAITMCISIQCDISIHPWLMVGGSIRDLTNKHVLYYVCILITLA